MPYFGKEKYEQIFVILGEVEMSQGEHSSNFRHLVIQNSTSCCITGYNRINVEKYILNIPYSVFDILEIHDINFSESEWEKVKYYIDRAREEKKIVIFKHCSIYEDDFLMTPFYKGESSIFLLDHPLTNRNNNDGIRFHSTESITSWAESKMRGDQYHWKLLDGVKIQD
jgi:hypothetical protein